MVNSRSLKWVGQFIRQRRESLKLSQKALGKKFDPPVTTQFISNVERGVTPLPPNHVQTLAEALLVKPSEITELLQKEYSAKINGRSTSPEAPPTESSIKSIVVAPGDYDFMRKLYDAFRKSGEKERRAFLTVCESMFTLPRSQSSDSDSSKTPF